MADRVRVGFIGCGGIANWHFGHFEAMDSAVITAVCDVKEDRVREASERLSARAYADYHEMLDKEELDAVYVCVEPFSHDGMELLAIEKGCHLFVQKPVTLDPAYAQRVQKALVDRGVVSAVGYQLRYDDSLPRLRAWLEHQEVGLVTAFRIGGMPWVWWWRQKELSGGQLVEMSTHEVDLLRYLFGEVRSVQAMAVRGLMTDVVDYDTDDAATVVMHFESGVQATLHNGCFSGHGGRHGITVFTKDGNAQVRPGNGFAVSEPHLSIDLRPSVDTGQEIDETFIEAVQSGDGSLVRSSYADGCRTLAVTLAANRSMERHGEPVNPRSVLDV